MDYQLGYFDEFSRKFAPKEDPFGIKLDKSIRRTYKYSVNHVPGIEC